MREHSLCLLSYMRTARPSVPHPQVLSVPYPVHSPRPLPRVVKRCLCPGKVASRASQLSGRPRTILLIIERGGMVHATIVPDSYPDERRRVWPIMYHKWTAANGLHVPRSFLFCHLCRTWRSCFSTISRTNRSGRLRLSASVAHL
jgi:hypothetical protein